MNKPDFAENPSVAAVVVNYRVPDLALAALRSLAGERDLVPGLRVVLVDGGSGDGSAERLAAGLAAHGLETWVDLVALPLNGGFGWANNQGIRHLLEQPDPPAAIYLLNPDAEVEPGALRSLVEAMAADPAVGAVGSQLLDAEGHLTGSAFRFPSIGREFARGAKTGALQSLLRIPDIVVEGAGDVDWVSGASVLLRTDALREVGLFDTGFFLYFEETELMWRLKQAGWRIRFEPASRVRHLEGAATGVTDASNAPSMLPPLPAYWFASRRRFFTRTHGPSSAPLASLAWLAGHLLLTLRRAVRIGGDHRPVEREGRDLLRHGLRARAHDRVPGIESLSDSRPQQPKWMDWSR